MSDQQNSCSRVFPRTYVCAAYVFGPTVLPSVVSSFEAEIKSSQNVVDSSHVCGTNLSMDTAYQAGIGLTRSTAE